MVLVLSPSPTLVNALTQNWYFALSMILDASKTSMDGLSIFFIGFDYKIILKSLEQFIKLI